MQRGVFLGCEESGVSFKFKDEKTGQEKDNPQMRWSWELNDMAGNPVFYVNEDIGGKIVSKVVPEGTPGAERAKVDSLSSEATGPKSKYRKWVQAMLGRTIEGPLSAEQAEALIEECKGKESYLTFGPNQANPPRITVSDVITLAA